MNQMNQVIIEGNVVRSAQVKEFSSGKRLCTIPVGVNRTYKNKDGGFEKETSFFEIEAWGENFCAMLEKNAVKGRELRVVGRLKQNRWKNDEGKSESKVYILADHIEFKPYKKTESENGAESVTESASELEDEMNNLAEAAAGLRDEAGGETVF